MYPIIILHIFSEYWKIQIQNTLEKNTLLFSHSNLFFLYYSVDSSYTLIILFVLHYLPYNYIFGNTITVYSGSIYFLFGFSIDIV